MALEKDGFSLYLSISKAGTENELSITIWNQGNLDTRNLPAPPNSKVLFGNKTSTIYVTETKARIQRRD